MNSKLCLCFNDLAMYRESIYIMMDKTFDADWYIEDIDTKCKEFDSRKLKNIYYLHTICKSPIYWIRGLISLLFKPYTQYLLLGSSYNLSLYLFIFFKNVLYKQKKVYLWTHGWYGKETSIQKRLKKWMFSHVDGNFVYGEYAISLMKNNGIDERKLWPIHNSLNYDDQLALRLDMKHSTIFSDHFGNDNPVLVMIGRLTLRKHLDMLIHAVSLLKERKEYYNVLIIGDGEDKNMLQDLSKKLNVQNSIWFYGACYDEKTNAELLYNSDMCVVPGDIGLTAIHSMMFGVPCITHNEYCFQGPEFEAIKEGVTGSFFKHKCVESLSETISSWFSIHQYDRENVRKSCYQEIDTNWNPYYQIEVLKKHLCL